MGQDGEELGAQLGAILYSPEDPAEARVPGWVWGVGRLRWRWAPQRGR